MTEARHPDLIRQDIERSREELSASVEALVTKVNVKQRAGEKLHAGKRLAASLWEDHRVLLITAGVVVTLVLVTRASRDRVHVPEDAR